VFGSDAPASDAPQAVGSVAIPAGLSQNDVKESIIAAFVGREWTVRDSAGDHVTGTIKHRGQEAILTVNFSASQADLLCQGWEINSAGAHTKFELPKRWIEYIKSDLAKNFLARSAKQ
jgi:hypothetical protein